MKPPFDSPTLYPAFDAATADLSVSSGRPRCEVTGYRGDEVALSVDSDITTDDEGARLLDACAAVAAKHFPGLVETGRGYSRRIFGERSGAVRGVWMVLREPE